MRITGGALCGRTVKCPEGEIRPAMDKMRESVFAILGDLAGKSWLDLFSGSGVIAIEAVSRGAARAELCEKDRGKARQVIENVALAERGCGVKIGCHFMAVELFVKRCKGTFDYIFLDPPFPYRHRADLLREIDARAIAAPGGMVMVHFPAEDALPARIGSLALTDTRRYGRSVVNFYVQEAAGDIAPPGAD